MKQNCLTEGELKACILRHLMMSKRICRGSILANELPLSTRGIRADLAILTDVFVGVEIKSNRDSLRRLDRQLDAYARHFQNVILVLGDRHAERALHMDAPALEIWVAHSDSFQPLKPFKEAGVRPDSTRVAEFRARFASTSQSFWKAVGKGQVRLEHLRLLSRFEERRQLASHLAQQQDEKWRLWNEFLSSQMSVHSSSVS